MKLTKAQTSATDHFQKLGDLFDFKNGRGFKKSEWKAAGVPIIRIQNLNSEHGSFNYFQGKYDPEIEINSGDLLFSWSGTVGSSFGSHIWNRDKGVLNQHIFKVNIKGNVEKRYAFFGLRFITEEIEKQVNGAVGLVHITKEKLNNFELPIPPLDEQKHIVAILDEAFAAITKAKENAEKNLRNAKELFASYLQGVFANRGEGWEEKRLSELCDIKHGFAFEGKYFSNQGEYVLLTPGNFFESGGYRDRGEKQKYFTGKIPADFILNEGDLLVAMTEQAAGLLGSPILVPSSNKFLHNQRLGLVTPKAGVPWVNSFFFHVFNTPELRQSLFESGTGVKVRHTSPTKIGNVLVRYPNSVKAQKEIVSALAALSIESKKLETIYQQKLTDLEELKKSILQKAFSGELSKNIVGLKVLPFPVSIPNISATDLHAGILAITYQAHATKGTQKKFGHVKAEKIAHMVENWLGINLNRNPVKDAAGPNDFKHLHNVESRARKASFFTFKKTSGNAYQFIPGRQIESVILRTKQALGDRYAVVENLLEIMVKMDTRQAEIFATVYAAWNNLLLSRNLITDEDIVFEARENWHPEKLKIPRERFFDAIKWMKDKSIVPMGKGKAVEAKKAI